MRIVFMGTPDFAVPSLRALVGQGHQIAGVFTQPDRPAGRGKKLKQSPVKMVAEELGLPVFQPGKIKTAAEIAHLRALAPDCIVVVAYGQLLSKDILDIPRFGCVNVHASLLPAYRGAAPIQWAVINGEERTGVTTMLMDQGLDTGAILLKREIPISEEDTMGNIHDQLADLGGELLQETLRELEQGRLVPVPQTGESNYAPLLNREHEALDWQQPAQSLHNQIRGLNPWPGAFTRFREEIVKVWRSSLISTDQLDREETGPETLPGGSRPEPGEILAVQGDSLIVQTGEGMLRIFEVQPSGKRAMPARDFFNGRHGRVGEKFHGGVSPLC